MGHAESKPCLRQPGERGSDEDGSVPEGLFSLFMPEVLCSSGNGKFVLARKTLLNDHSVSGIGNILHQATSVDLVSGSDNAVGLEMFEAFMPKPRLIQNAGEFRCFLIPSITFSVQTRVSSLMRNAGLRDPVSSQRKLASCVRAGDDVAGGCHLAPVTSEQGVWRHPTLWT